MAKIYCVLILYSPLTVHSHEHSQLTHHPSFVPSRSRSPRVLEVFLSWLIITLFTTTLVLITGDFNIVVNDHFNYLASQVGLPDPLSFNYLSFILTQAPCPWSFPATTLYSQFQIPWSPSTILSFYLSPSNTLAPKMFPSHMESDPIMFSLPLVLTLYQICHSSLVHYISYL